MSTASSRRQAFRRFMDIHELRPTPWCQQAGIPESTLRSFLSGRSSALRHDTLEKLARAAGVSIAELVGEESPQAVFKSLVPIASLVIRAGARLPVAIEESDEPPLFWPGEWVERFLGGAAANGRYLELSGETLVASLHPGDTVCIDVSRNQPNRDPGIYCLHDGIDLIVRRVQGLPRSERALRLLSDDARYSSLDLDLDRVQVLGRVVWRSGAL